MVLLVGDGGTLYAQWILSPETQNSLGTGASGTSKISLEYFSAGTQNTAQGAFIPSVPVLL
jgi:hypothetical protein